MSTVRKNRLVVDFSVLPKLPNLALVQRFVEEGLRLDPKDIRSIQLHNIRHYVLIEMADPAAAIATATKHNLKHTIKMNPALKIAIPVYVEDDTVNVRIHDLPPSLPNQQIAEAMREYGEVLTIRDDVWKKFFIGIPNGVRLMKMKLSKPIPSYITVCDFNTLVTYTDQVATCRRCGSKRHVGLSCYAAAKKQPHSKPKKNPPNPIVLLPTKTESQVDMDDDATTPPFDDEHRNENGQRDE